MPSNFCSACVYIPADDEDDIPAFGCPIHAAAPALLEAAQTALNDFDRWGDVWQEDNHDNYAAAETLRAAIIQATQ
jgi:hypothetical protein